MGEFTDYRSPLGNAQSDANAEKTGSGEEKEQGYPTDVEGVTADDVVKKGNEEYPMFDVSSEEFFNNMQSDRKKLRFKNNSKVTQYKTKTKNSLRPFYIRTQDSSGKTYTRKIR